RWMALMDFVEQADQQLELGVRKIRVEADAARCFEGLRCVVQIAVGRRVQHGIRVCVVTVAPVDQLDADGLVVQAYPSAPVALTRVPGPAGFRNEFMDAKLFLVVSRVIRFRNEVVRTHRVGGRLCQDSQRIAEIGGCEVNDDETDSAVVVFGSDLYMSVACASVQYYGQRQDRSAP